MNALQDVLFMLFFGRKIVEMMSGYRGHEGNGTDGEKKGTKRRMIINSRTEITK